MTTLKTADAVLKFLNETFNDNFEYHDLIERHIWAFQAATGTGLYRNDKSLNFTFHGQIGTNVVANTQIDDNGEIVATFTKTTTANRKKYSMVHTVKKAGDTYSLVTFWEFLYESFLQNMDKMRGNSSFLKAVEFSGKQEPTDQEVATVMATITYVGVNDTPVAPPKIVTFDAEINPSLNSVHIKGVFKVDGVEQTALRYHWYIDPEFKVPGLDTQPRAGGEYVGKPEFEISSDFRVRDRFTIMRTDAVRVRCFCQYLDEQGDLKQVVYDQVHDFSNYLPVYDYFGLASGAFA